MRSKVLQLVASLLVFAGSIQPGLVRAGYPALAATAPARTLSPAEQAILAAEKARFDALLTRDIPTLTKLLTEDVSYVHAEGFMETNRKDYLARVAAGKVTYTSFSIENTFVKIVGNVGVTHGIFHYEMAAAGKTGTLLYTGVYQLEDGIWKLVAWHTTRKAA